MDFVVFVHNGGISRMRTFASFMFGLFLLGMGCSSAPTFKYDFKTQPVTIITEPTGAEVWQTFPLGQPNVRLGVTPLEKVNVIVIETVSMNQMPASDAANALRYLGNIGVEIRKEGYKPYVSLLAVKKNEKNEHRITLEPKAAK